MKMNSHKNDIKKRHLECRLAFRVTAQEKNEIMVKAQQCAMSQSDYIRRCVVACAVRKAPVPDGTGNGGVHQSGDCSWRHHPHQECAQRQESG